MRTMTKYLRKRDNLSYLFFSKIEIIKIQTSITCGSIHKYYYSFNLGHDVSPFLCIDHRLDLQYCIKLICHIAVILVLKQLNQRIKVILHPYILSSRQLQDTWTLCDEGIAKLKRTVD